MGMMDTRSERSTLESVTNAAWERNGWDVFAIARTEPASHPIEGICAFVYTPSDGEPCYGTAFWLASGLRINFEWGHYELSSPSEAMRNFRARTERGY